MGRQFVVYLILYFTLLFVVSALPRPETDDLLTLVPPQKQTTVIDKEETKSVLARIRDCLKGGQFDITKGCRPQRVDKHVISMESPSNIKTNSPQMDKSGRSGKHQYISNEVFDCLTSDLLLI